MGGHLVESHADVSQARSARPRRAPGSLSRGLGRRRLLLVGGGPRPREAMRRFASWAGPRGRLLVIAWASATPCRAVDSAARDVEPHAALHLDVSARPPATARERQAFLAQVSCATAVFFTGGDQTRIMAGLDPFLARALRSRHRAGVAFGGTSAGTAIMSPRMIVGGDPPRLRAGLALLPGTILDQHFLERRREGRLRAAVARHPDALGVGVDEGAALLVEDGRHGEVVGGRVALVSSTRPYEILEDGARFDLRR